MAGVESEDPGRAAALGGVDLGSDDTLLSAGLQNGTLKQREGRYQCGTAQAHS